MNLQKGCRGSPNHRGARAQAHRGVPRRHRFNVATIQCQPAGRLLGLIVSTLRPRRCKVLQTKPRQASWSLTPGCILMPPASASILPRVLALGPSCAPLRRSSNANSLCGGNSAGSPKICATFQRDILRRHFLSSSPLTPARQSGLPKLTCEHRSKRRDTAATPLLADLLHLIAGGIVAACH